MLVFSLLSCRSAVEVKKVDYSDSLSVFCEIDKAEQKLNEKKTIEALSIAKNLVANRSDMKETEAIYEKVLSRAREEMEECISRQEWKEAFIFFESIKTCGYNLSQEVSKQIEDGLKSQGGNGSYNAEKDGRAVYAKTIDEMIDATVTVFVDKGIKVEKGLGRSDAVLGSGFFIDSEGYFITNYHVIQSEVDPKYEGYSKLYIKNLNGSKDKIPAQVVGYDPLLDLALVKTQAKPSYILKLGSSEELKIGSKIYAIGSPLGLERTITSGIVSSKNRELLSLADVIQIDAAINHGSSGGPIVDEKGAVQAIVFAGVTRTQGLNFAIPVELLKNILPSLYSGGENSHIWLSAFGKDIDDMDDAPCVEGVVASYLKPLGSLSNVGVEEDCIITELNGIQIKNLKHLKSVLLSLRYEVIVRVGYMVRAGNEWTKKVCYPLLKKRPQLPALEIYKVDSFARCLLPFFGIKLEYAGRRRYFRVKKVIPHSYGDEAGFTANDHLEIRNMDVDEENGVIQALFYVKKLKSAYIESFMGVAAYADNPEYF